jgi:hypothetical protein
MVAKALVGWARRGRRKRSPSDSAKGRLSELLERVD